MQKTEEKSSRSAEGLYKFFIYFVLILLAVTIIVPVAWPLCFLPPKGRLHEIISFFSLINSKIII